MASPSQAIVLLLLLSTALAFRVSPHRVHKKDGHDHDIQPDRSQLGETPDSKQLEDTGGSIPEDTGDYIPEDIEISILEDKDSSEVKSKQADHKDNNQEDTKDNNQEYRTDKSKKDTEDNSKSPILSMFRKAEIEVRSNSSFYAFFAQLTSNVEVSSGSPILFDNVLVNEGGLYFGTSGQFACTDDGAYVFIWSLRPLSGDARGLGALAFGGENIKSGPQTSFYSDSISSNGNSQMVSVVQCRISPVTAITVRSMSISPPTYMAGFSSFAGFRLSSETPSAVAFTAELSKNVFLYPGGRIMFDHIVSNVGGHYDNLNGFFRCPDDGVYSFSVSTYYPEVSSINQWSVSRLMFHGASVLQGPMTYMATTSVDSGSSSVTALVQCQQGKDVYVEAKQSYTFVSTEYGADLTSFSGFRLCSQCDDLVAFSAVLTENVTTSDADIPFESVLLARGDAYNPLTGVFTCPDVALYMFQWSATSISGNCYLDLYVNDSRAKRNHMTTQSSSVTYGTSGTAGQSSMVWCSDGDKVSVRGTNVTTSRYLLAEHTTFSGYRVPGQ